MGLMKTAEIAVILLLQQGGEIRKTSLWRYYLFPFFILKGHKLY